MPACITSPPQRRTVPGAGRRTATGSPSASPCQKPVPPPVKLVGDESERRIVRDWWSLCARNWPSFWYTLTAGSREANSRVPAACLVARLPFDAAPPANNAVAKEGRCSSTIASTRRKISSDLASAASGSGS
eukprot:2694638-Rhodomonas_salina.2